MLCLLSMACLWYCRERNDGLYRVITYLCSKMIEELGIALLSSLAMCEWDLMPASDARSCPAGVPAT